MRPDPLGDWRRTHFSTQIKPNLDGQKVTVFGWVEEIRDLGGIKFVILRDKDGEAQITIPRRGVPPQVLEMVASLQKQSVVGVKGVVRRMEKAPGGAEVIPDEVRVLSVAKHPLPLDPTGKVPAELDVRLDARVLDLRRVEPRAIFKVRHIVVNAIRSSFLERGYLEVTTPKIIASATEGGAALFPIAYYDREAFLAQSPQLYKEQLTGAFEKVFEVGPIFRAEESNTRRHLSESTSVDMEEAFIEADDVMDRLEEMMSHIFKEVKGHCEDELKVLKRRPSIPERPFGRYTYDQTLEALGERGISIPWGEDITTSALRTLGRIHKGFYFITDWPTKSKPFYIKPREDRSEVCEAFDLMYSWLELASGGTRVESREMLTKRLQDQGLNPPSFEYHLRMYDYGMPPHAGFGLGLERLVMVITGRSNIREVTLFPRDRFRITP